jgi:hypothetical protein
MRKRVPRGQARQRKPTRVEIRGIAMKIRERNVVRSFQKLRRHQSNGRILNMIDYTTASEKRWRGRPAVEGSTERRVLFHTPALNNVIFVKHNLRRNEREIFPSGVQVATKIFVPFDTKRLEVGGRSFFIEEPNYAELLKEFFQMDAESADPALITDLRILEVLAQTPTLDPFVICERLRAAGIKADPELFSGSYTLMRNASQRVFEVFQPLLEKALSKMATPEEMSRFAEQIWNVTDTTTSSPFLEALRIPRSEWVGVIFAWKALIYYDISSQKADERLGEVIMRLKKIRVQGNQSQGDQQYLRVAEGIFTERLRSLRDATARSIKSSLDRLLGAVKGEASPSEFSAALREMAAKVSDVGADVMLFDQVTSYFLYLFPSNSGWVAFEDLSEAFDNLSEILSFASCGDGAGRPSQMAFA